MMKVPFYNESDKPVYIGLVLVPAGGCRDVESSLIPSTVANAKPEMIELSLIDEIKSLSIKGAVARFDELNNDELNELHVLETAGDNPRAGLLSAISEALLKRGFEAENETPDDELGSDEHSQGESE